MCRKQHLKRHSIRKTTATEQTAQLTLKGLVMYTQSKRRCLHTSKTPNICAHCGARYTESRAHTHPHQYNQLLKGCTTPMGAAPIRSQCILFRPYRAPIFLKRAFQSSETRIRRPDWLSNRLLMGASFATTALAWSPTNCMSPGSHTFSIWFLPLLPCTLMFACNTRANRITPLDCFLTPFATVHIHHLFCSLCTLTLGGPASMHNSLSW